MNILKAPYHFALLSHLDYTPHVFRRNVKKREHSSFLYISSGSYRYAFSNIGFTGQNGALIYLPQGANYQYEVLDKNSKCLQIELDIISEKGERVMFSDVPLIAGYYPDKKMKALFESIISATDDILSNSAALCAVYTLLFSVMKQQTGSAERKSKSKIQPAFEYIQMHYTEKFSMQTLANLCFLSESQMRRSFRAEYKCSPLVYKNNLIFDLSKKMLKINNYAVSDIADALGFSNVYAFSRFFKKRQGCSPTEFRKSNE